MYMKTLIAHICFVVVVLFLTVFLFQHIDFLEFQNCFLLGGIPTRKFHLHFQAISM